MAVTYVYKDRMLTAEEITNLYLYGQPDKPSDMLDTSTWGWNQGDGKVDVEIDYSLFLNKYANLINAASFELIRVFMGSNAMREGVYNQSCKYWRDQKEAGILSELLAPKYCTNSDTTGNFVYKFTKAQIIALYGMGNEKLGFKMVHLEYIDPNESLEDYLTRSYMWATQAFMLSDKMEFYIETDRDGNIINRWIENFSVHHRNDYTDEEGVPHYFYEDADGNVIGKEDFDFEGGSTSNMGNAVLEQVADPSGIGNRVDFLFVGDRPTTTITQDVFNNLDQNRIIPDGSYGNLYDFFVKMQDMISDLFNNGKGPTAYLYDEKAIIYSGDNGSTINGTITGTGVDISKKIVPVDGIPGVVASIKNELSKFTKDGIVYVGGAGADHITGTDNDDILYGYGDDDQLYGGEGDDILVGGEGNDHLYGGKGYDKYYIGEGADYIEDEDGKGAVYLGLPEALRNIQLTGGQQVEKDSNIFMSHNMVYRYVYIPYNAGAEFTIGNLKELHVYKGGELIAKINPKGGSDADGKIYCGLGINLELFPDFLEDLSDLFSTARTTASPIALDLDGDGVESTGASSSNVMFDLDGDGIKNITGWTGADDGLLAWDRNGDGIINNGSELFGEHTLRYDGSGATCTNGWEALAQEDTNGDGVLNQSDTNWDNLRVWRDLNQNGVTDTNELFTLSELGITEISTGYEESGYHNNGNYHYGAGSYTTEDGETHEVTDIFFDQDTLNREFLEPIEVPDELGKSLPNFAGSGALRDLIEACVQSPELQNIVSQFAQATTHNAQIALIDDLLYAWANTSGMAPTLEERDTFTYAGSLSKLGPVDKRQFKRRKQVFSV